MSDSDLDELRKDALEAAERERKRKEAANRLLEAQSESKHEAAARRAAAKAERRRRGLERATTWHALKFPGAHDMDGVPWVPVVFLPGAIAAGVPGLFKLIPLGLLALLLGLMVRSYLRFRTWRTALPFELQGWQALVEGERPPARELWQRMTITVTLPERPAGPPPPDAAGDAPYREIHALSADDDRADHVLAALTVFVERANRAFYTTRNEDYKRSRWTVNGTRASGSGNADVLWRIHLLCQGPLAMIARKRGSFTVALTTQGEPQHVSVPSTKKT